jgi:hypothetical protein
MSQLPTPGFNLPYGVSQDDPHIVGSPLCDYCGHEAGAHDGENEACTEPGCDCKGYESEPQEPDEDWGTER